MNSECSPACSSDSFSSSKRRGTHLLAAQVFFSSSKKLGDSPACSPWILQFFKKGGWLFCLQHIFFISSKSLGSLLLAAHNFFSSLNKLGDSSACRKCFLFYRARLIIEYFAIDHISSKGSFFWQLMCNCCKLGLICINEDTIWITTTGARLH